MLIPRGPWSVCGFHCESLNSTFTSLDREASYMWTFRRTLRALKCTLSACTAGSSSTQMVCSHINHDYLAPRVQALFTPCHLWTEAGRNHRVSPSAAGFGIADIFWISICVFSPTVYQLQQESPRPKRITCPQEVGISVNLWTMDCCCGTKWLQHRWVFLYYPSKSLSF